MAPSSRLANLAPDENQRPNPNGQYSGHDKSVLLRDASSDILINHEKALHHLLADLDTHGIAIKAGIWQWRARSGFLIYTLTWPWWSRRIKKAADCSNAADIELAHTIDQALKASILFEPKITPLLVLAQIKLALKSGLSEYTGRAVAYAGLLSVSGFRLRSRMVSRQVQLAISLMSGNRFRSWREPIVGEWMGFLLPWTYPRRLTTRRIDHLVRSETDKIDPAIFRMSLEYELSANLFTTQSISGIAKNVDHLRQTTLAIYGEFWLTEELVRLSPELNTIISQDKNAVAISKDDNLNEQINQSMHGLFRVFLRSTTSAILGEQLNDAKINYILRSWASISACAAVVPPASLALIVHNLLSVSTQRGKLNFEGLRLTLQFTLMISRISRSNHNALKWSYYLLVSGLALHIGLKKLGYNNLRLARIKARESGQLLPLAYTLEQLARFSIREKDDVLGRRQLKEARALYAAWGSEAKLRQLEKEFGYFQPNSVPI